MPPQPQAGGFTQQDRGFGCMWKYVKNNKVFLCPTAKDPGTPGADPMEPTYTTYYPAYGNNALPIKASYHFWPQSYQLNIANAPPPRMDVDLNNHQLCMWQGNQVNAARRAALGGPLVMNFLHPLDPTSGRKGVVMLNIKGAVRFLPLDGYPYP